MPENDMKAGLYIVRNAAGERVNYIYWDPQEDPQRASREGVMLEYDQPSPFPPYRAEPGPLIIPMPPMPKPDMPEPDPPEPDM